MNAVMLPKLLSRKGIIPAALRVLLENDPSPQFSYEF